MKIVRVGLGVLLASFALSLWADDDPAGRTNASGASTGDAKADARHCSEQSRTQLSSSSGMSLGVGEAEARVAAPETQILEQSRSFDCIADSLDRLTDAIKNRPATVVTPNVTTPVKLVVANAGGTPPLEKFEALLEAHEARWDTVLQKLAELPPAAPAVTVNVLRDKDQAEAKVARQIEPYMPVSTAFPDVDAIEFAVLLVPDPLVPRHRRSYEQNLAALTQGMLDQDYVLDRYVFPWQQKLQNGAVGTNSLDLADDGRYGLMIFRHDGWRDGPGGTSVRAIYVVPETATYGVAQKTLRCAMSRIETQLRLEMPERLDTAGEPSAQCLKGMPGDIGKMLQPSVQALKGSALAVFPLCEPASLPIFGPGFSGSLDSIRQALSAFAPPASHTDIATRLCLISSATTVSSNRFIDGPVGEGYSLNYQPLAVDDDSKLDALAALAHDYGVQPKQIAFLREASIFGAGFCGKDDPSKPETARTRLCKGATKIAFPPNIADIRLQRRRHEDERKDDKSSLKLPALSQHLKLEEGIENGSEFPDSGQSGMTDISSELQLMDAIRLLRGDSAQGIKRARIVVVVATDVRDRLFLIDLLREQLPQALLVDFETDRLLAHPDVVHASRGALTMASSRLVCDLSPDLYCDGGDQGSEAHSLATFSSDKQALLYKAVSRLGKPLNNAVPDANRPPMLHVVGYDDLHPLAGDGSDDGRAAFLRDCLRVIALLALAAFVYAFRHTRDWIGANRWAGTGASLVVALVVMGCWRPPLAGLWLSLSFLLIVGITLFYLLRSLHHSLGQLDLDKAALAGYENWACWRAGAGTLMLFALAVFEAVRTIAGCHCRKCSDVGLHALGVNASSGLAYTLALMLAAAVLVVFGTARLSHHAASCRNRWLMQAAPFDGNPLLSQYQDLVIWQPRILLSLSPPVVIFFAAYFDGDIRLSVFGDWAGWAMLVASAMMAQAALLLAVLVSRQSGRMFQLTDFIGQRYKLATGVAGPGPWSSFAPTPLTLPATPILAEVQQVLDYGGDLLAPASAILWREQLEDLVYSGANSGVNRFALFALLASEVSQFRRTAFAAMFCALAGIGMNYLFPLSAATPFLLLNIILLIGIGLWAAFTAVRFERDAVLSPVLTNTPPKLTFSTALFGYIALPFVLFGMAIAIIEVPGVVDWGGGVFGLILKKLGFG